MFVERTGIKICGLTDPGEIMMLNECDVDYAGFVFAKSTRNVSFERAAVLSSLLRPGIIPVGVFENTEEWKINELYEAGIIEIAQIHGGNVEADKIIPPVWISVPVGKNGLNERTILPANAAGLHLDTYDRKLSGGTGRTFDWRLAVNAGREKMLILAGGLNHTNIREALETVRPDVADVSSGVEKSVGGRKQKDRDLINRFVSEVRKYDEQQ